MRNNKWIGGQGLVEFALILPILLLLVVGALDFGRAFYMKTVMENSAREGAYYMVNHTDEGKASSFALAKAATQIEAEDSGFTIPVENITVQCVKDVIVSGVVTKVIDNTCLPGSTVIVTVESEFQLVISALFGGPFDLVSDARMMIP